MKFKLIPIGIIELELFENTKDKKKRVWVWVTWGFIRWKEFHTNDFSFSEDCETIEEIQSKLDEVLKKAVPVSKDKEDEFHLDYKNEDDLYNIVEIAKVLGTEEDSFINDNSGGGANAQVFKWENVTEKEKQKTVKVTCRDEENISLEDAAESWQDDVLEEDFGYQSIVGESFYRLPLKVVAVEEEPKTEHEKTVTDKLGLKHLALLDKITQAVHSKAKKKKEAVIKRELPKKFKEEDIKLLIKVCKKKTEEYSKELKFLEKINLKKFKE